VKGEREAREGDSPNPARVSCSHSPLTSAQGYLAPGEDAPWFEAGGVPLRR